MEIRKVITSPITANDVFKNILSDPDSRRAFKMFSVFDFCEETFQFFDLTEKYKNTSPERLRSLAQRIYKRFLSDDASQRVSLPPDIASAIRFEMEKNSFAADKSLFDSSNSYIYAYLKRECLARFLLSDFSIEYRQHSPLFTSSRSLSPTTPLSLPPTPLSPSHQTIPVNLTNDFKFSEQKYLCHIDRSLRRNFLTHLHENDFDNAMEFFELLVHSGGISVSSGYYKPSFLLLSIATEKQIETLRNRMAKEGMYLEMSELVMLSFALKEEELEIVPKEERIVGGEKEEGEKKEGEKKDGEKKLFLRNLEGRAPHSSAIVTPRSQELRDSTTRLNLAPSTSKEKDGFLSPRLIHTNSKDSLTRGSRRLSGHAMSLSSIYISKRIQSPCPSSSSVSSVSSSTSSTPSTSLASTPNL